MYKKKGICNTIKDVIERNHPDIKDFLSPNPNPQIVNLKKAVNMLKNIVSDDPNIPIKIVGDYDVDGIKATVIMVKALRMYGLNPSTRIPHRFSEGYGLSEKIIDEISDGLIITVDNGIAAIDAIKKAKEKGLYVIITDHHLPQKKDGNIILPEADIIVDPWVYEESEYTGYCGAGLAYRFAKELLPKSNLDDLKVLAAIATIADIMPLKGANRLLVQDGLKLINKGRVVPGLRHLLRKLKLEEHITEDDFAFTIGPIINASGRLYDDGASSVLDIFVADWRDYQLPYKCGKLIDINEERKKRLRNAIDSIDLPTHKSTPLVIYDPDWGEGIVGLIAGKLCEKYHVPVIAFTRTKSGQLKGSGRSIPGIHLKNVLDSIPKDILIGYGGHEGAAGLSIKKENLKRFEKEFEKACGTLPEKPEITYDLELPFNLVDTLDELDKYAPYGAKNPKVRFHFYFKIDKVEQLGDGTHIRLSNNNTSLELIGFDMYNIYLTMGAPSKIEVIGYLSNQWFNGNSKPQIEMLSFCPAESL